MQKVMGKKVVDDVNNAKIRLFAVIADPEN